MDKWDEAVDRIRHSMLAEEPEAAMAGALQLLADFGRAIEKIGDNIDRLAIVAESKKEFDL